MFFWDYSFSYIFKGYQNKGEKNSAHIYALCVLTLLLSCNILSVFFIVLPDGYLKTRTFKELVTFSFVAVISLNGLYFLKKGRYLKMAARYYELNSGNKRKGTIFFWIYFINTIIVLIVAL